MTKPLVALFVILFITMVGFGITLPVLPFYVERLAGDTGKPPAPSRCTSGC